MQDKFRFLGQLPQEMGIETAAHLATPDLIRLSMTSKGHRAFFKPVLEERKVLQKFIHHLVRGEHNAVKEMLKKDINLMVKRDQVTDCSDRTFPFISGFEYALWALDKHMWTMMLDCLPKNEQGNKIFVQLLSQYNRVNTDGVTYRLHGKTITEKHFDFKNTIIKELQTQTNFIMASYWNTISYTQWLEGVGGAQKLLPMHVVDEYCSSEPFYTGPQFTSQPKSSRQFFNWMTGKYENWFGPDSQLAIDFAIVKVEEAQAWWDWRGWGEDGGWRALQTDVDAMTVLCEVRMQDFINLKSQLEEQVTLNNCHQIAQIVPR
ncbi:hypothetical protein [Legionella brunensis]|uniref:Uncharacterized protein n=1 Tax=Legionella brunensis TaxID=29422 RepID=A0A0W0SU26_9GAMM|nr:hypothetical protein [Legionella brunensis]KTC86872.1 hypothetical protein Lbru_0101 [Legionella brunensis]